MNSKYVTEYEMLLIWNNNFTLQQLAVVVIDGYSPRASIVEEQVAKLVKNKDVDMCAIAYGSSIQQATVQAQIDVLGVYFESMLVTTKNRYCILEA